MRLLYDHQIFEAQKYGGISRYFYELITRAVHELDVALFMGFHINEYGLERVRSDCRAFFGRRRPSHRQAKRVFVPLDRLLLRAFALATRPDIHHATYYADLAVHPRRKRVLSVYDMIHERYAEHFRSDDPTRELKRRAVAKADQLIAISHSTKRDLIELLGVPESKIAVTHLANSLHHEVTEPSALDRPYVLYVANRTSYYKGFDTAISAFARSRAAADLDLVCFGGGAFTPAEREQFDKLGITSRVHQLSGSDELLARLYKHATVFVYPSRYEGFGLPPLEAMHYGCPVIAARTSSIPEVVGDAGIYFEAGNADELEAALDRVVGDSAVRSELVRKGIVHERTFTWDRTYAETLAIYRA